MVGLIMKLIICPVTLIISDVLFRGLNYATVSQAIIVGVVLALSAHMMELLLLRKENFWISTIADFIASFAIVYFSQFFFANARITFSGALFAAILLTFTEYFQHMYLIKTGRTRKTA